MSPVRPDRRVARLLGAALSTGLLAGCLGAGAAQQEPVVAFVGATVIPMDAERALERHTVIVRGGRIAQVGPSAELAPPAGAQVIDAAGKFLIPGLTEMHAHIPGPGAGGSLEGVERTLFLYLAGGVTTIRGMQGSPLHLELRERAARGELLSPRVYAAGPALGGAAMTPEAAAAMVRAQKAAGYDLLKIQTGLTRATFDAMDRAADEVGIPYAGHVPAAVGLNRALEARYASIDHLDGYVEALAGHADSFAGVGTGFFGFNLLDQVTEARIPQLAAATRAAGVAVVPTQTLMEQLASPERGETMAQRPEMRFMPAQTVAQWVERKRAFQADPAFTPERAARYIELRRRMLKALHDAGATILLGSDAPQWWNVPGFSARREAELMVAAGLTPWQVLETATSKPAAHLGGASDWGTIQPGRSADLLLLDADPLQDIRNLWRQAGVMVRGTWLPQGEIDRRLEQAATAVR